MFIFTVLIRVFECGQEIRTRKDVRLVTRAAAESARKVWSESGHKVSPIVRLTGGAS